MSTEERVIQVMGTTAHVIAVDGPAGVVDDAVAHLETLESQWSRFRPDSEVSRLNERPGVPVIVSPSTFELIDRAIQGWRLTEGRFDPTLLREVCAAGYDRSFELVAAGARRTARPDAPGAAPSAMAGSRVERITLDRIIGAVTLGADVQIDPGGIGKGLAADLVVERMLAAGARGALVNVGGDLRVDGAGPDGAGWVIAVTDPTHADDVIRTVALDAGAVASTWRTKRAWVAPDGTPRHHLIDPTTGRPAASGLAGVTVITGRGWQAEVLAKAAFLAGLDTGGELLDDHGVAGLLIGDDGTTHEVGAWAQFRV